MTNFDFSKLNFSFDLSKADYQMDILQQKMLEFYLRADPKFRRAFSQNYTSEFLQYLKDKAKLREPVRISTIGQVRSAKSYSMMSICIFLMACYKKVFTIDYVCGNAYEFLEKLKTMEESKLKDSCFLIDEEKQAVYGVGSVAKKMKITDVQNIIAINNISTIMINPVVWADKEAQYGLRTFGRCFKTKTVRLMLYNLQSKGHSSELPMGCIYLPSFTSFLPSPHGEKLEKEYLDKKNAWVQGEMRGFGDVLYDIKQKSAEVFIKDDNFLSLKKKSEKIAYIGVKLGSEWTKSEINEIYEITNLLNRGVL